jgi:hypothetical protein
MNAVQKVAFWCYTSFADLCRTGCLLRHAPAAACEAAWSTIRCCHWSAVHHGIALVRPADRLSYATSMLTAYLAGPMKFRHIPRSPQQLLVPAVAPARCSCPTAGSPAVHDATPWPQRKRLHSGTSAATGSWRPAVVLATAHGRSLEFATAPQPGRSGVASAAAAGALPVSHTCLHASFWYMLLCN